MPIANADAKPEFRQDGSQFDHLFRGGESFRIGQLTAEAMHVPGHTPADLAYRIGDTVFVGGIWATSAKTSQSAESRKSCK